LGQLGLGTDRSPCFHNQSLPQLCEYLAGKHIVLVAAGSNHTVALTKIAEQIETIVPSSLRALFQANSSAAAEMNRVVEILLQASEPDQPADAVDGVIKEVKAGVEGMLLHASHHLLSRVYDMVEEASAQQQKCAAEAATDLSMLRTEQGTNNNAVQTLEQRITILKKQLKGHEDELTHREERANVLKRATTEKTEMLRAAEIKAERIERALDRLNEADIPLADAWDQWQKKITEGDFKSWSDQDVEVLLGLVGVSTWLPVFKKNSIPPSLYSELTPAILKKASTTSFPLKFGDRCRLLMTIDSILNDSQPTIYGLPQAGEVNIGDVSTWDVATVVRHFRTVCKIEEYARALEREMVIGRVLLTMTDEDLINELNVEGVGMLMKMNTEVQKLVEYTRQKSIQAGRVDIHTIGRFKKTASASVHDHPDISYHLTSDRLVITSASPKKHPTTDTSRRPTIISSQPVPNAVQQPRKLMLKGNARRTIMQTKGNQSPLLLDQAGVDAMNQRARPKPGRGSNISRNNNNTLGSLLEEDAVSYEVIGDEFEDFSGYSPQPPAEVRGSRASPAARQRY
jgi:hypothetical protein